MEFRNLFLVFLIINGLTGCQTVNNPKALKSNSPYEQGFKDGVTYNVGETVEELNGNDFPYAGTWSQPIVQEVKVPAHIQNGVFYPESNQTVLITPGEWKKNEAFPIKSTQKENRNNENTYTAIPVNTADITVLPQQYSGSDTESK